MHNSKTVPAGDFKKWLDQTRNALQKDAATDVPCNGCTACCTSSYFIHIRPYEKNTLKRIPKELLSPAPGLPKGHQVIGFDEKGHCPMLKDNICTIYKDRPLTCRSYDCRVFSATGLPAGARKKAQINQRVESWRFSFESEEDRKVYHTVRQTTKFLVHNKSKFPKDFIPSNTTQLAILAIKVHPLFIGHNAEKNTSGLIQRIVQTIQDTQVISGTK